MDNIESNKIDQMLSEFKIIDTQINDNVKAIYGKHEVWRRIKDYDNYSISSFGRVRNDDTDRILKPQKKNTTGYHFVRLYKKGKKKNHYIHRLAGIAFLSNHDNKPKVDHIDEDKTNNNIINLRFATVSQNSFNKSKQKNKRTIFCMTISYV